MKITGLSFFQAKELREIADQVNGLTVGSTVATFPDLEALMLAVETTLAATAAQMNDLPRVRGYDGPRATMKGRRQALYSIRRKLDALVMAEATMRNEPTA